VGVDIFRDQPVPANSLHYEKLQKYWKEDSQLVGICNYSKEFTGSVAPPESITPERVGFVDLYSDPDDHIRRYLLSRSLNSPSTMSRCNTPFAFAWQLAYRYLKTKNIPVTTIGKNWQFGDVLLLRLKNPSGGYQNLEIKGNQIVINYRRTSTIAQKLTIRDVLEKQAYFNPEWVKGRIILIGVTAPTVPDRHDTFLGKMNGIEVHTQVTSEIISAVEDGRPLIWWLPPAIDYLWILFWSSLGAIAFKLSLSKGQKLIIVTFILLTLYGVSWLSLYFGLWLPMLPAFITLAMNIAEKELIRTFVKAET
jgi:CHASE2 domain-containing sensor protein